MVCIAVSFTQNRFLIFLNSSLVKLTWNFKHAASKVLISMVSPPFESEVIYLRIFFHSYAILFVIICSSFFKLLKLNGVYGS